MTSTAQSSAPAPAGSTDPGAATSRPAASPQGTGRWRFVRRLTAVVTGLALISAYWWWTTSHPGLQDISRALTRQAGTDSFSELRFSARPDGRWEADGLLVPRDQPERYLYTPGTWGGSLVSRPAHGRRSPDHLPLGQVDWSSLDRDLRALRCDKGSSREATVTVLPGGRVARSVRCGNFGEPQAGYVGDRRVERLRATEFRKAAEEAVDEVHRSHAEDVAVTLEFNQGWRWSVVAIRPGEPTIDGGTCLVAVERGLESMTTGCGDNWNDVPAAQVTADGLVKVWEAEGRPAQGWAIHSDSWGDHTQWTSAGSHTYGLDGQPVR